MDHILNKYQDQMGITFTPIAVRLDLVGHD